MFVPSRCWTLTVSLTLFAAPLVRAQATRPEVRRAAGNQHSGPWAARRSVPARPAAGSTPAAPVPFHLTPQQQTLLDQILHQWERESEKIKTFRCTFERWEYDPVFLKDGDRIPVTKSGGQLKYAKPDKGLFRVTEIRRYEPNKRTWEPADEPGEHWVCDGQAVYEFNAVKRQLIVRTLPPEMRGNAIADGPLPFLFSADAEKLKRRYFIRVTDTTDKEIWLEAYPRYQRDAANFRKVELILDRRRFLPSALQMFLPNGKCRTVYMFHTDGAKVNDPLERFIGVFQQPRTPFGWTRLVDPDSPPPARQAERPSERSR